MKYTYVGIRKVNLTNTLIKFAVISWRAVYSYAKSSDSDFHLYVTIVDNNRVESNMNDKLIEKAQAKTRTHGTSHDALGLTNAERTL